ncbi:O-antigen ligase family protein, partial [Candidatus Sumerlaeota bacterium]|nr:O-antigen ligase family protein [Candidatus Sumerlaeota bacterium]
MLCYPMRLQQGWLGPMVGKWKATETSSAWSKFCVEQFEPFISFYHSPLILKGTLAAACIMAAAGAAFAVLMLRPLLTPRTLLRTEPLMLRLAGLRRFGFLLAFLLWSALSASWSPTRALSLDVLFWIAIFGGFAWLLLRRGISYDETRQLGLLLLLIGTVVAVVCLLEATEAFHGIIFDFLLRFDDALRRNIYGSLIGHNSAVGSFMLMTAFIAFAFAVDARSAIARWAAIAYLGLDLMAAFTTQSRSTWIFGPILGTAYLVVASRQRGRSWPWRLIFYVAALLAMGFCSQTIHSRWNPFYLTDNPFAKRIRDLSYRGFAGDARARLFVCSLPLVAEKPITGHGLYSFQYVYPKAQGEYFARHPGSKLSRTTFRSDMAHDEYLQILVEQGVIGLTLFLLTLGEIYWRGRRTSISLSGPSKLLHASFGFAVLAFCCDALVNFPL